jgi:outer membrane protein assembly factor BamB
MTAPRQAAAQDRPRAAKPLRVFAGAEPAAGGAFEFTLDGFSYHVGAGGNGRREKAGSLTRRFNLRLEGRTQVAGRVYFAEYEGDLLLAYEVADGARAAGRLTRLRQPSMRAAWNAELPRGGVGPPAREGRFLYATAAGFAGKLDLATGAFAWSHEDLRPRGGGGAFDSFDAPEVEGEEVLFRGRPVYNGRAPAVYVDKRSGRITRVE